MAETNLETLEIETSFPVNTSVIWMHGLGADGHDFEPIVPELRLEPGLGGVRFIFPHAPMRPVTINGGFVMRAWFDILGLSADAPQDEPGIRDSAQLIQRLIERENQRGIPASRIVLAGFSQGGVMALHVGLRYPERLLGIMGLSCLLALDKTVAAEASQANREIAIFLAHGSYDPMLPVTLGQQARDRLTTLGYRPEWREYPMPHSVCPEEIADIAAWLTQRIS